MRHFRETTASGHTKARKKRKHTGNEGHPHQRQHTRAEAHVRGICSNVARNLGTLTFCRYRENRRIPTMQFQILKYRQRNYVRHFRGTTASGPTGAEGAGGSGGHGRASRSTTPSDSKACGDLAGGRARRRPEHQRRHTQRCTSSRATHTQHHTSGRATSNQAPQQPRNANARQPTGPPRVHATSSHTQHSRERKHSTQSRGRALSAVAQPPPRRPGQHSGRRPCAGCRRRQPG